MEYAAIEIDMRRDFSDHPQAALPVPGTLALVGKMREIEKHSTVIVEVMDHHDMDDPVSQEEFKTYPPHCIDGTWGHKRIEGLFPLEDGDLNLKKNTYDAWDGIREKEGIHKEQLEFIIAHYDAIVVGGVVTGICVKAFVDGAIKRGLAEKVIVIEDCVANLDVEGVPKTEDLFHEWTGAGVRVMTFEDFIKIYVME